MSRQASRLTGSSPIFAAKAASTRRTSRSGFNRLLHE